MDLSFLTPAMLVGAALVAVPIVLHLVMRQVPKHMVFPAVRFIVRREQANRRQLQLRHLLLLLLRAGAIALLALALARPSIKAKGSLGSQEAPVAAALVFDTSPRMAYREDNQTRLEVAQSTAHWLLGQLPAESEVAVLESEQPAGDFAVDLGAAEQRIAQLKPAATATPLTEVDRATPAAGAQERAAAQGDLSVHRSVAQRLANRRFGPAQKRCWTTPATWPVRDRRRRGRAARFFAGDVRSVPKCSPGMARCRSKPKRCASGRTKTAAWRSTCSIRRACRSLAAKKRFIGVLANPGDRFHTHRRRTRHASRLHPHPRRRQSRGRRHTLFHIRCPAAVSCAGRGSEAGRTHAACFSRRHSRRCACAKTAGRGSNAKRFRSTNCSIAIWKNTPPFACSIRRRSTGRLATAWRVREARWRAGRLARAQCAADRHIRQSGGVGGVARQADAAASCARPGRDARPARFAASDVGAFRPWAERAVAIVSHMGILAIGRRRQKMRTS